jgi:thiamine-phosphate pyrophosphorylase
MLRTPIIAMVTDRRRFGADEAVACERLVAAARHAADAGVDLIQIRESGLDDHRLLALTRGIVEAARGRHVRVLVNARADVAMAGGAHGVHLRGTAPPASRLRGIASSGFLVGRSVHSIVDAIEAERDGGCDYLIFGTVFPSASKRADHPVAGAGLLARVCASVRLPVLAIGGMTVERAGEIAAAGAGGLAAIDLFAAVGAAEETKDAWPALISRLREAFARGKTTRLG